jgi:stearoyl-CoA desaturase (delta-9 desaturase)
MFKNISDFNVRIRILQTINHLAMFAGFGLIFTGYLDTNYLWIALASYLGIGMLGTTVGLHRYFSHRAFETNKFWHYVLGFFSTVVTVGSILGWAGLHRFHHKHSDQEQDPHNPHEIGAWDAWFYNWKPSKFTRNFIKPELKDPMIMFLHRHYFKTIFAWIAVLAAIDPWLVIFVYAVPACGAYFAISALTVIGHVWGYTNYDTPDTSKNSWLAWFMSLGEGWHNNHHADSGNWRQGHKWWELDPNAWIIWAIKKH